MNNTLCIYHGNCADGFAAAWVVRKFFDTKSVDFHPGVYGAPPPDVTGRDVILVDFSYKRDVLIAMAEKARFVLLLDHHKTAAEDLAGLPLPVSCGQVGPAPADWGYRDVTAGYNPDALSACARENNCTPLYALFDMNRSGAGLAWDFFFPHDIRPALINHIEDRDLWRFSMSGTREIQATVFSHPYDFDVWDGLMNTRPEALLGEGAAIERKHHKDIAELLGVTQRTMLIGGYAVPVANLPYTLASDAGHIMAMGERFAATYYDDKDGSRVFSLRSTNDGLDVAEIAKQYGGGGHRNAAGFRLAHHRIDEIKAL